MTQEIGEEEIGKIQCLEEEIEELRARVKELSHGFTVEQRVRLINTRGRLQKEVQVLQHERNQLAAAIGNAAIKAAITDPYANLTTQQLIAICDNLAEAILNQQANLKRLQGIRELCGYVQDGSHMTLQIAQDDATNHWSVYCNKRKVGDGTSFFEAIDNARKETK